MELINVVSDVADAIQSIDSERVAFRSFRPGVGPYGEPQLVKLIADRLNTLTLYGSSVRTKRTPDLLIPNEWAIEFKIARPFGDNGLEAEDWSVNLLHPYPGNVSTLSDCCKLVGMTCPERRAVIVVGYEHNPPRIDLDPLVASFELIAKAVLRILLSPRVECRRTGLVHPVHQTVRVFAWEVIGGEGQHLAGTERVLSKTGEG